MTTKKKAGKKKKKTEPMPSLIFQNTKTDVSAREKQEKIAERPIFKPQQIPAMRGAKIWMWAGVGIFSLTIILLWGWAMKIRLDTFSWQKTPENKMVETAKTDWNKYFAETKTLEENKRKIKNAIERILANSIVATTTIVTTTIINTTNSTTAVTK